MKTVQEIGEKIRRGEAVVYTAAEFKALVREGEALSAADVDVVTTGTCGVMSGTAAILSVPVAPAGSFERAEKVWLNGVPCLPGPCPNERLGLVDLIVSGTAHAGSDYGGGHLLRDLAAGNRIEVVAEAKNQTFEAAVTLEDLPFARMFTTRSAFKNYTAFVNRRPTMVSTIFSVRGLRGPCREVSVSGCGEINPLQNDPARLSLGAGASVLLNGAAGIVVGEGTRSSPERPNLSISAEICGMRSQYLGGFRTSASPECFISIAVPIPVLDERSLAPLRVLDEEIPIPIADINDRKVLGEGSYGAVWQTTDRCVQYYPDWCEDCSVCFAAETCPTGAFSKGKGIDRNRCIDCGTCITVCPSSACEGDYGSLRLRGRKIPITLRQSSRRRAEEICIDLKEKILSGDFPLSGR
ncbi:methanogenesis marker 16 metalloprotein [Methanoculleus sp. FWC-SCC1]|uniref:Methanogenesis marker 16 metalloprotein n=1 Tax=Methanoculleus frigidifontis TaxID=2584085 RepID=A0ABT8MA63_9EURY|nr:methanogenesis marker 16 metalloprotein [Methanoculleus sp. FWC-SCC1]MDN7024781.1 methanogenesis marker 16 metalloprotein [Methanoculleus sp. FWC-SCC1]